MTALLREGLRELGLDESRVETLERFAALLPLTAQGYAAVPETGETPVRGVFDGFAQRFGNQFNRF